MIVAVEGVDMVEEVVTGFNRSGGLLLYDQIGRSSTFVSAPG